MVFPLSADGAAVAAAVVLDTVEATVTLAEVTDELSASSVLVCAVAVASSEAVSSVAEAAVVVVAETSSLPTGLNDPALVTSEHRRRHNAPRSHDFETIVTQILQR